MLFARAGHVPALMLCVACCVLPSALMPTLRSSHSMAAMLTTPSHVRMDMAGVHPLLVGCLLCAWPTRCPHCGRRRLQPGECVAALLDDVHVVTVTAPACARDALDVITSTIRDRAGVAANLGRRRLYNRLAVRRPGAFLRKGLDADLSAPYARGYDDATWRCLSELLGETDAHPAVAAARRLARLGIDSGSTVRSCCVRSGRQTSHAAARGSSAEAGGARAGSNSVSRKWLEQAREP